MPTFWRTLYLDVRLPAAGRLELPPLAPEQALYAVQGSVEIGGEVLAARAMAGGGRIVRWEL